MTQSMGGPSCSTCNGGGQAFNGGGQVFSGSAPINGFMDTGYGDTSMGNAYSGVVGNAVGNCGGPGPDPGYHMPVYSPPFQLGQATGQVFSGGGSRAKNANWVAGVYAMSFSRDYENRRKLSRNLGGGKLDTRDADEGDFGGYQVDLTRRSVSGRGLQLRYWAFNPGDRAQLDGPDLRSVLPTLDQLTHVPTGLDVNTLYAQGADHTLVRNTDINNFEANILGNGGNYTTRRGRTGNFELLAGFRYFQFDESLTYTSNTNQVLFPGSPDHLTYQSEVENQLVGAQLGARNQICLTKRWSLFADVKAGVFNNRIDTTQFLKDETGTKAVLASGGSAGSDYYFSDDKDDVAILGELDLGVTYMINQKMRARFGYRTFGVAGVALAGDQIPNDFTDTDHIQSANSNGSLLLHGGYAGLEACF